MSPWKKKAAAEAPPKTEPPTETPFVAAEPGQPEPKPLAGWTCSTCGNVATADVCAVDGTKRA